MEPFDEIFVDVSAGQPKTKSAEFLPSGQYPLVDQGKNLIGGYTNDSQALSSAALPLIVFGDHTRTVKYVDFPFGVGADGVKLLRPRSDDDVGYLFRYLQATNIPAAGYDRHFKYLKRLKVPRPPIHEQRRIANILEKADDLRDGRRASRSLLDSLGRAIFRDMFGDVAVNSRGFPCQSLCAIASTTSGGTPDRSRRDFYEGGIPWVKSGELRQTAISTTEEAISPEALRGSSAKLMPRGTVLLAMYGATAGKVAILEIEAATNQAICCISVGDQLDSHYLLYCLSALTPALLSKRVGGAQPNLSQGLVRSLPIPLPAMPLQAQFRNRLSRVSALAHQVAVSSQAVEDLFSSLQQRAFAGQL